MLLLCLTTLFGLAQESPGPAEFSETSLRTLLEQHYPVISSDQRETSRIRLLAAYDRLPREATVRGLGAEHIQMCLTHATAHLKGMDTYRAAAARKPELAPLVGLTSTRMADLLDRLGEQFDWILFDTPPVGLLPDAQLLARLTRAVVFVIAAGVTPQSTVERAVAELGPECVIGTVLNRVEDRRIPASGYYARYGYDSQDRDA